MDKTDQDEFAGQGGSYVIDAGGRRRVEETVEHPDGNCARDADGKPVLSGVEGPHGASDDATPVAPSTAAEIAPPLIIPAGEVPGVRAGKRTSAKVADTNTETTES